MSWAIVRSWGDAIGLLSCYASGDNTAGWRRRRALVSNILEHHLSSLLGAIPTGRNVPVLDLQVSLLASARLLYHGPCDEMATWFQSVGYTYTPGAHRGAGPACVASVAATFNIDALKCVQHELDPTSIVRQLTDDQSLLQHIVGRTLPQPTLVTMACEPIRVANGLLTYTSRY
jgi:hypothetical protein